MNLAKRILIPTITFLTITFLFEIGLTLAKIPIFLLPKPSLVIQALVQNWQWITSNLQFTLYEAIVGFTISIFLGVALALTYLFVPSLKPVIVPFTVAIRNVPFVAIAPILFLALGYGAIPKIIIVVVVSFFPIMTNISAGFEAINHHQHERFFILRATKWQLFTKLQLPTSLSYLVCGLEIAVSNIVIAAIVGELLGTTKGIGFVIVMSVSQYQFPLLMAAVLVTTAASITITWIEKGLSNRLFRKWL